MALADDKSSVDPGAPHIFERLEAGCAALTRPVAFIGVIGMLVVSGVTIVDVVARWLFASGIVALNEIVAMTFAVTVAATLPAGLAQRVNIKIDLLESAFIGPWKARVSFFGEFLLLVFFGLLAWGIFDYALGLAAEGRSTIIYGWPTAPFYFATAALLAFGAVVQAVISVNVLRRARFGEGAASGGRASFLAKTFAILVVAVVIALVATAVVDFAGLSELARAHPATTIALGGAVLWAALLAMVPLGAVLGLIGFFGSALFIGFAPSVSVVATESAGFLTNVNIAVLPLFLMMGSFAVAAGVSDDVYRLAQALLGTVRGSLALATIAGCAGFGAMTGSSLATMATFGRISLPEMRARGYSPALATGSVAAGGNLGALIPPSGPLILFALLTEVSIGQLFIAAILPGILAFVFYALTVMAYIRLAPDSVPPRIEAQSSELLGALRQSSSVVLLFGVVMGGIYTGIFTVTEAAAVGAFSAFVLALARGRLRLGTFWRAMADTTSTTALIYTLIFGGLTFTFFVEVTAVPRMLTSLVEGLDFAPLVIIALILLIYIGLGCVMDAFAILIITVPILTPVVVSMGYDIVWWGIINLAVVELGLLTPPFGISVFVLRGFARDVPITTIFKGVLPFCAADVVKIALLVAFPVIALWLPSTMLD